MPLFQKSLVKEPYETQKRPIDVPALSPAGAFAIPRTQQAADGEVSKVAASPYVMTFETVIIMTESVRCLTRRLLHLKSLHLRCFCFFTIPSVSSLPVESARSIYGPMPPIEQFDEMARSAYVLRSRLPRYACMPQEHSMPALPQSKRDLLIR